MGKGGKSLPPFSSAAFCPARPASSASALRRTGEESPNSSDDEGGGLVALGVDVHPRRCIVWFQSSVSTRSKLFGT
jgi:hypothetical protein